MIKKALFIGGGLVLLLGLFFGRDACGIVSTYVDEARTAAKNMIPMDMQLKRAENAVKRLGPEIRSATKDLIREQLAVENLEKQVSATEQRLAEQQSHILRLKNDLDSGEESYVYSNANYTRAEVTEELETRFEEFTTVEKTLEHQKKSLSMRREVLNASRKKISVLKNSKKQLALKITNLKARLKRLEVAQNHSELKIDDSQFSHTQKLITELEKKVSVQERMLNAETELRGRIPLDAPEKSSKDILERVAERFGSKSDDSELVTNK